MMFVDFLQSAYDHAKGRPKTALPTRYHYIDIVRPELETRGITLSCLGQHAVILKDRRQGRELIVVVRYTSDRDLALIARRKASHGSRLAYLIDDDYWAMLQDDGLNEDYRARLAYFLDRHFARLRPMLDAVVAPSHQILNRLPDLPGVHMQPAHLNPSGDLSHFDNPKQIRMVFLGTSTHGSDFARVAPGIAAALKANQRLHLTTLMGKRGGALIPPGPQVTHLGDMFFPRFQAWLTKQRFHIGLAPYEPNPVNDGRSNLKFHQHALVGAVGLYSQIKPFLDCIKYTRNGYVIEYIPEVWQGKILDISVDILACANRCVENSSASTTLGSHVKIGTQWQELL